MKKKLFSDTILDRVSSSAIGYARTTARRNITNTCLLDQMAILTGVTCAEEDLTSQDQINKLILIGKKLLLSEQAKSRKKSFHYDYNRHIGLHNLICCLKKKRNKLETCCANDGSA